MPTIPIVPETASPVPFAITPSTVTEAKLIAAYAEWDGTGASGNFLPCLAIYSDAGVRLGRVFPSSPVAAGDTAVVTYAPFPGGLVQKSAGATGASMSYGPTIGTLAANASMTPDWGDPTHGGAPDTGSLLFDFTAGYDTPAALKTGVYTVTFTVWPTNAFAAENDAYARLLLIMAQNTDSPITYGNVPLDLPTVADTGGNVTGAYLVAAGDTFGLQVRNLGASQHNFQGLIETSVVYL